jgi:hypothetical protein
MRARDVIVNFGFVALASLFSITAAGAGGEETSPAKPPRARRWLLRALDGASLRLRRPECRALLRDFTDRTGRSLEQRLAAEGASVHEYLKRLHFFEAPPTLCGGRRLAFTAPGSRVIFVCSDRFQSVAERNAAYVEAAVIHEALHSLGLGEDPPTSAFITERVLARCAR